MLKNDIACWEYREFLQVDAFAVKDIALIGKNDIEGYCLHSSCCYHCPFPMIMLLINLISVANIPFMFKVFLCGIASSIILVIFD